VKLTPSEILQHLGFNISADGVEVSPDDAYLVTRTLRLAGATISIDRIPDDELNELHNGMAGMVLGWGERGLITPISANIKTNIEKTPSDESLQMLRATLNELLQGTFKRNLT
jgi:hypothetical protein